MSALIIGSDSFIARRFLFYTKLESFKGISRTNIEFSKEIIINNFFSINEDHFKNIDLVFNFSAIVHRTDIKDANIYDEVNHKLTILNAKKAKQAGVKLFIQMSTIAVYGNASDISIKTPYNPQNPYGFSKLRADEELFSMQDDNFKVAIVRPPMVYGGGKAPGNMMRLIKLTDKGIPLPFKGVDNKKDFINVHNLVQYLEIISSKQLNGIHLISDQEPVSTEFLLKTISYHLGKKVRLIKIPSVGLRILRTFKPNDYNKLFSTLSIETNFPYENLINRFSVEDGICEMVVAYKRKVI